jgi:hypothetical protein
MKLLRSVDGHTHQEMIVMQKLTPLIGEQCSIGLHGIVYLPAACIFLLQFQRTLIESQRSHQRFAAVPLEHHLVHGLCLDEFLREPIQQFIRHHLIGVVGI